MSSETDEAKQRLIEESSSDGDADDRDFWTLQNRRMLTHNYRRLFAWSLFCNVVLLIISGSVMVVTIRANTWGWNRFQQTKLFPSQLTYSPAQDAIEYEVRVFNPAVKETLPAEFQQPPGEKLDAAWMSLYQCKTSVARFPGRSMTDRSTDGILHIDKQTASYLTNKTIGLPSDPEQYVTELDVFHQLHCLVSS
jgi:hypothetical protein